MWNENLKWFFEEGTPNGFNEGGIAEFTSTKYDGLAREIIQNSLDARKDDSKPVKVVFEKITLPISYFPNIDEYLSTVQKCLDFLKDDTDNKSVKKLEQIKFYLNNCKRHGSFNILKNVPGVLLFNAFFNSSKTRSEDNVLSSFSLFS